MKIVDFKKIYYPRSSKHLQTSGSCTSLKHTYTIYNSIYLECCQSLLYTLKQFDTEKD